MRRTLLVAAALVAAGVAIAIVQPHPPAPSVTRDACRTGPLRPDVTPVNYGGAFLFPYGAVRSCRILERHGHWSGRAEASAVLRLETEKGLVFVRAEYRDIDAGRQMKVDAYELAPGGVPGDLSTEDTRRHRADVDARGGVQKEPWILNYGDG